MSITLISANCPKCGKKTKCDLLFSKEIQHTDEHAMTRLLENYNTVQCRGCETVFFQIDSIFSENDDYVETPSGEYEHVPIHKYKYYPSPTQRKQPSWSFDLSAKDKYLSDFYDELYIALNSNLIVLSTIGVRAVLERSADILKISGLLPAKIDKLFNQGYIGQTEKDLFLIVKEAGNAAAHRAWRPTVEELNALVDVLDQFLYRTFVLRHNLTSIEILIPPRS